ncbi:excisionase [Pantoea agglomerans]|uniref:helix-turn-helix transcriptional regulator n=1 Tax=Enterobacter agglomerans TaxID=549 RepID=UPI00083CEF7F|nr:AlpA family phage regulatory protein [Pantoea agglomerans]AOE41263.1 excisionase [Pantoea agglomerans]
MATALQPDSLVDLKFIMRDTGFGKSFIYERIKDGKLPPPKKIGRCSRWSYQQVQQFKSALIHSNGE